VLKDGSTVLFATLFSTIFSAYTVVGVPMEANQLGWISLRWLTNGVIIGWAALIVTPRLYRTSIDRKYLSPNDLVTDRYNNRLLSTMTCLLSAGSIVVYIVTQFFAMQEIMEYLSDGHYDTYVTTWVLGAIIWISEILGGFDATTMTDAAQSGIMIVSFIALPIVVSYWYGGAVPFFRQKFSLEDAIGSHACSLEANMRGTNGIPLGCPLLLPVGTVNCVQTLKVLRVCKQVQPWDATTK
jgi:Na+/proline symporter